MSRKPFRLAVAQTPGNLASPQERLDWLSGLLPDLRDSEVDLVLLPELFATGYNIGENTQAFSEAHDGPSSAVIAGLARKFGVAIHYGYVEASGGTLYNSAQCFGPDGDRIGGHRKLILPPGSETGYFAAGEGCSVFEYRGLRIATLICYDAEFPETARFVSALGADLILVPTALSDNWAWVADKMIPTRAFENGVYLAYANHAGVENGLSYLGHSFIAGPDGKILAQAGKSHETLVADIFPERVKAAQARLPYLADRRAIRLETADAVVCLTQ